MRTTAQKGLGGEHQRLRRQMLPKAYGQDCELCGLPMLEGMALELDHVIPRALGGHHGPVRIVHAVCNRRRGGQLQKALRKAKHQMARTNRW